MSHWRIYGNKADYYKTLQIFQIFEGFYGQSMLHVMLDSKNGRNNCDLWRNVPCNSFIGIASEVSFL